MPCFWEYLPGLRDGQNRRISTSSYPNISCLFKSSYTHAHTIINLSLSKFRFTICKQHRIICKQAYYHRSFQRAFLLIPLHFARCHIFLTGLSWWDLQDSSRPPNKGTAGKCTKIILTTADPDSENLCHGFIVSTCARGQDVAEAYM